MKKTYFAPETEILNVQNVEMIALSIGSGYADGSDALVRGQHHSLESDNIWGEEEDDEEEDKKNSFWF